MMIKPVQAPAGETALLEAIKLVAGSLSPAEAKKELEGRKTWRKKLNADIDAANKDLAAREAKLAQDATDVLAKAAEQAAAIIATAKAGIAEREKAFRDERDRTNKEQTVALEANRDIAKRTAEREKVVAGREAAMDDFDDTISRREAAADQKMIDAQHLMDEQTARRKRILAAAG